MTDEKVQQVLTITKDLEKLQDINCAIIFETEAAKVLFDNFLKSCEGELILSLKKL